MKLTLMNVLGAIAFLTFVVGCNKVVREAGPVMNVEMVLIEAKHTPSTFGMKYGYHYSFRKGKMVFGSYMGTIDEKYSTVFQNSQTGEKFSSSSKEICTKLAGVPIESTVNVLCRDINSVTYENNEVVEKRRLSLEIIDVVK